MTDKPFRDPYDLSRTVVPYDASFVPSEDYGRIAWQAARKAARDQALRDAADLLDAYAASCGQPANLWADLEALSRKIRTDSMKQPSLPCMPPTLVAPVEWCWSRPGDERAQGPFSDREEAITDARENTDRPFYVGQCEYVGLLEYVSADADLLLDEAWDHAHDASGLDENPFVALPGAEEALNKMLQNWAQEWVSVETSPWQMVNEVLVNE